MRSSCGVLCAHPAADAPPIRELGEARREAILAALRREGRVHAAELAERFGVSLDTVRRDLQELADAGALRRVHGGALPAHAGAGAASSTAGTTTWRPSRAIAVAAVRLIRPGEVVALSGGSTVLEVAQRLPDDLAATVITTSPDIAVALADHPALTVDLIGGRLHPDARTVTGPEAVDALRRVRPDACVLSACSLHPQAGPHAAPPARRRRSCGRWSPTLAA